MPTYGYRCQSCSAEFEVLQRMSDLPEAACPSCSGAGKRLFYPAGILFKGSGFYKTDSRGSETKAVNGSAEKAGASSTASPSKPADSTASKPAKAAPDTSPSPGTTPPKSSTPASTSTD